MGEDGDGSDWIEVSNGGEVAVDLEGWFLTDDESNPTRWRFPSATIDTKSQVIVFASGKDRLATGPAGEHHANFGLRAGGEYLALVQPDGVVMVTECDELTS